MIGRPNNEIAPKYYIKYFDQAEGNDLITALKIALDNTLRVFQQIDEPKGNFAYAENKWTIKQVLLHVIDTERMLAYRAMRFSRNDATPLPGGDENLHALHCGADQRTLNDIIEEYQNVRAASIPLFIHMTEDMLHFRAMANHQNTCALEIGWMMAGHDAHHLQIIKERYLPILNKA